MLDPLEEIAVLVQRSSGIALRPTQREMLLVAVERVAPGEALERLSRRLRDPDDGGELLEALLEEVTVKETYFLREAERLAEIPWGTFYARARASGGGVRVWSAGCATGEEAYTLALLATEAVPEGGAPLSILATDISEAALDCARTGRYRPRSTRELDAEQRRRYFVADGEALVVGPDLRRPVSFAHHNLAGDPMPPTGEGRFDLIVCRNVLIYFDRPTAERVTSGLLAALRPQGSLVLGAADALSRATGRLIALAGRRAERTAQPEPADVARPRLPAARDAVGEDAATGGCAVEAPGGDEAATAFLAGIARLGDGDGAGAVSALRRALYSDPQLGLAAFQLGRAYELVGDLAAACRAYEQTLRSCGRGSPLEELLLEQIDVADVLAATRARLDALAAVGVATPR